MYVDLRVPCPKVALTVVLTLCLTPLGWGGGYIVTIRDVIAQIVNTKNRDLISCVKHVSLFTHIQNSLGNWIGYSIELQIISVARPCLNNTKSLFVYLINPEQTLRLFYLNALISLTQTQGLIKEVQYKHTGKFIKFKLRGVTFILFLWLGYIKFVLLHSF